MILDLNLETKSMGSHSEPAIAHPDWHHVKECLSERQFDPRWKVEVVAAFRDGELLGAMPISTCRGNSIPDANLRTEFQQRAPAAVNGLDPLRLMFLGGHAYLRGGVSVHPKASAQKTGAIAAALVTAGVETALAQSRVPIALFVPDDQMVPVTAAWRPRPLTVEGPAIAFLPVPPGADFGAYLATLRRAPRQCWQGDLRRLESSGIRAAPVQITQALLAEAAPIIADIKTRHGVADHPRLTQLRLRNWFGCVDSGLTRTWAVRDRHANLLGISIAVVHRRELHMVEIGLVPAHASRRDLYIELVFHAPTRTCLAESLAGIDLGSGSLQPKLSRGAILRQQWHLFAEPVAR